MAQLVNPPPTSASIPVGIQLLSQLPCLWPWKAVQDGPRCWEPVPE